jgi:hypothetical protein
MARRHRKQSQANRLPWPVILAVGGVLLVVAAFFLAIRGGAGGGGTPKIAADPQKIDYGYVTFGNNKSFTIKVTNTGDGVLRFKDQPYIEVLEGC